MYRFVVLGGSFTAVLATLSSAASAGQLLGITLGQSLGSPLGEVLGLQLGTVLPIAEGGLLGLVATSVIAGVWLVRRKR